MYTLDVYTRRGRATGSVHTTSGGSVTTRVFVGRQRMTRRSLVGAALAVGVSVPIGIARRAGAVPPSAGPVPLTLPPTTGPYPVGTVSLHLVDRSRPDPVAGPGHYRELMASVWYPARDVGRYPLTRWMPAAPLRGLLTDIGFD